MGKSEAMEFVSKRQAYDAAKKLAIEYGFEDVAKEDLYNEYVDEITADPLSPQDAMAATALFLEKQLASRNGNASALVREAKQLGDDPEKGDPALWNRWIELLAGV